MNDAEDGIGLVFCERREERVPATLPLRPQQTSDLVRAVLQARVDRTAARLRAPSENEQQHDDDGDDQRDDRDGPGVHSNAPLVL